jgi:hypothetical protein
MGNEPARFGLCDRCAHQTLIANTRGSTFSRCDLGLKDPDWPKYPRMPVLQCPRYEPVSSTARRASTS